MINYKKTLTFSSLIAASILLTACGDDEKDEEKDKKEKAPTELNYENISQQIKVDSYLNKIEDYEFQSYFYPSGIDSYDRTIMSKTLNKFNYNPYFYDLIYAMTNGDFDEKTLVKEYNTFYEQLVGFKRAASAMRNEETIEQFNKNEITLQAFKELSLAQQTSIHEAYKAIKNINFETPEGKAIQEFHLYYLDYWILEIDNQFETISRLTKEKQRFYNVTDFALRLTRYGQEGTYVDTYIILLEAKQIKELAKKDMRLSGDGVDNGDIKNKNSSEKDKGSKEKESDKEKTEDEKE